jgi:hypothetical protein
MRMRPVLLVLVLAAACGKDPGATVDASGSNGGSADASVDTPPGTQWVTLISRSWQMSAGSEGYRCVRIQVPQEMWIGGFRAIAPLGTHHTVLTIDPNDSATGEYNCNAGSGTLQGNLLFASGVGTDEMDFPAGVATHLTAGTWINLNLHLFDVQDSGMLADTSGIEVLTVPQSTVVHEADVMFAGTFNINIPGDGTPTDASGGCNAPTDWHVFSLWPHMHQTGVHQKFTVTHSGTATTMLDTDYTFTEQKNHPIPETIFYSGDQINVTCTYVNNTGSTITFGDSSTAEMCFTGMYKYPAGGNAFGCTTGIPH